MHGKKAHVDGNGILQRWGPGNCNTWLLVIRLPNLKKKKIINEFRSLFQLQYLRNLRNIHEVRSVNVSNAGNNSILQASDAKDNFKPSTSYYNTNTNETFPKYISGITIPNETEQLLESETEGVYSDKAAQSPGMVGKYLELIHSS